ncbi:MAG: acetyl-CoA C-acyltransferase [Rhodospirillaceae bacterium]|nr:acetyl-CoA C-acyltransferase [Rhodospirillaceae bacterium]
MSNRAAPVISFREEPTAVMAPPNRSDIVVFDAVRTPRGKGREGGTLAATPPVELVKQLITALNRRQGEQIRTADHFILGCVGQTGAQGGHIALVSKLHAGLAESMPAWSLNNFCVSGLSAVLSAAEKVGSGNADVVLAGGVESMSQVPFLADKGAYYTDPAFSAALRYVPVALSADVLAHHHNVTRAELDAVALASHLRAAHAQKENLGQQSLIPVVDAAGKVVLARDEYVRAGTTLEGLAAFPPAFGSLGAAYAPILKSALGLERIDHRHAVVHAPGTADGAGLAVIGTRDAGAARGLKPRARIVAMAEAGGDPVLSLTAGRAAMDKVLQRARMTLSDIGVIEYMEAFAVVPALFYRDHAAHADKVNVFGGHVARGHALGATGAILLSSLLDVMEHKGVALGMVVAFAASGIGSAVILQRE